MGSLSHDIDQDHHHKALRHNALYRQISGRFLGDNPVVGWVRYGLESVREANANGDWGGYGPAQFLAELSADGCPTRLLSGTPMLGVLACSVELPRLGFGDELGSGRISEDTPKPDCSLAGVFRL